MKMELELDGVKYMISPITPQLSPYATFVADLLQQKPQSIEEAEKLSSEIDKALEKLLKGTVKPEPKKEHHLQLYQAVIHLTNKVLEEAELFRGFKGRNVEESGSAGVNTTQTSKQGPRT